jgi:nucleoside-diphosphate kinase
MEFLSRGPVIAFVLEGNDAVANVRRLVGKTIPATAEAGTIRGDYSVDSSILANREKRAVRNLVHASGTVEEAKEEIKLWFKKDELV